MSSNEIPSDYMVLFREILNGHGVTKRSQFRSRVGYAYYYFLLFKKYAKTTFLRRFFSEMVA